MQVHIRKAQAGHASNGYTWDRDGAVVAVEPEHAAELLTIRDAGFEVVEPPAPKHAAPDEEDDSGADDTGEDAGDDSADGTTPRRRRRTTT